MLSNNKPKPIVLPFNDFCPRDYQLELFRTLRSKKHRHFIILAHRDYGKDFLMFQYFLFEMYEVPGMYHYIFQTYANAKNVIFDGITYEGRPIIDYIPPELLIGRPNRSELSIRIRTKCGNTSILKFIGSNNYNSLRGPKPIGIGFSESAYLHPGIFEVYKPIIRSNPKAWEIHISTPFGLNHFFDLYTMAKSNPKWFVGKYPISVTGKLTEEDMEEERKRGTSEDMIQQEYYGRKGRYNKDYS